MAGLGGAELMKTPSVTWIAAALCLAASGPARAASSWQDHADAAFAEAQKSDKLVLVDLFAEWCGWCKVMERDVFSTPEFQRFADRFVLLRVDVEDGGDGTELQQRFHANSLPTLLLLDAHRALVGEIQGFLPTDRLISRIESELRRYQSVVTDYDRALSSDDTKAWAIQARAAHQRGDGERAAKLFEKLLAGNSLSGDDLAWTRLQLADSYRLAGRFTEAERALAELHALLARANQPSVAERADLLRIFIARGKRDCAATAGALAAFEKGYPNSKLLADARRVFRALRSDASAQCT